MGCLRGRDPRPDLGQTRKDASRRRDARRGGARDGRSGAVGDVGAAILDPVHDRPAALLQPLKEEGLIRYTRGNITVLDRAGLEAACCECYRLVNEEYERVFGSPGGA